MTKKIILDVDTGTDDAVAIMLAAMAEELELLGVVAVNGNRPLEETLRNTLQIIELLQLEDKVPVLRGADQPLVKELLPGRTANPSSAASCTDENGNVISVHPARFALPEPRSKALAKNFVSWYIDTIQQSSTKVNIVCVGPLTNLALVLRAEPSLIQNIEEIVIMGGCHAVSNRPLPQNSIFGKILKRQKLFLLLRPKLL